MGIKQVIPIKRRKDPRQTAEAMVASLTQDVQRLQDESDNALDIFRKTINQYEAINEDIDDKVSLVDSKISELTALKSNLGNRRQENSKVVSKIKEFIS